ncbi:response regulator [Glaciecola sp. MH2013]|uniref:response regulator n=1 Tax=Glaciecola sp. MH2013 TaxID=2785524 RepID=UPI00189FA614|nr:response regulator [Glaciecola sp. MH2013]MBF7073189.1 response regulator [Glaciecola sp. MH2013]
MTKVLVVDDAVTVRMYHREIMEQLGYEVSEAENGIEGLEKSAFSQFDLMIVDVNMPKMDGYRFVTSIREDGHNHSCPVIMVSTEEQLKDKLAAYKVGANYYIVKPAKVDLMQKIANLMVEE